MSDKISAKAVGELRASTGAGLMACKKALVETNGDSEAAADLLRKKGIATAAKRSEKTASEGIVEAYIHTGGKVGVLLELNCETDFVAKNDEFKALANSICKEIAEDESGTKNGEVSTDFIAKMGENIVIKDHTRFQVSDGIVESYIHTGGKVGVLLELNSESSALAENAEFKTFARDICMHIAAVGPVAISRDDVPAELIAKETEIAQGQAEGKPERAIAKIVEGKVNKFLSTCCLLDQGFIKNPDQTIQALLTETIAKLGETITVSRFVRYQIG